MSTGVDVSMYAVWMDTFVCQTCGQLVDGPKRRGADGPQCGACYQKARRAKGPAEGKSVPTVVPAPLEARLADIVRRLTALERSAMGATRFGMPTPRSGMVEPRWKGGVEPKA